MTRTLTGTFKNGVAAKELGQGVTVVTFQDIGSNFSLSLVVDVPSFPYHIGLLPALL